jgi:hypothetical protein
MRATTNGPQNMSSNKLARIEIINAIREARTFDSVVILFGPTLLIYYMSSILVVLATRAYSERNQNFHLVL